VLIIDHLRIGEEANTRHGADLDVEPSAKNEIDRNLNMIY
jgi:hypothetical protein